LVAEERLLTTSNARRAGVSPHVPVVGETRPEPPDPIAPTEIALSKAPGQGDAATTSRFPAEATITNFCHISPLAGSW